jgi:hypothetical protein
VLWFQPFKDSSDMLRHAWRDFQKVLTLLAATCLLVVMLFLLLSSSREDTLVVDELPRITASYVESSAEIIKASYVSADTCRLRGNACTSQPNDSNDGWRTGTNRSRQTEHLMQRMSNCESRKA